MINNNDNAETDSGYIQSNILDAMSRQKLVDVFDVTKMFTTEKKSAKIN